MAMSRKDYEAIAEVLANTFCGCSVADDALEDVISRLADYFAADNPRFDRYRFLAAAGL